MILSLLKLTYLVHPHTKRFLKRAFLLSRLGNPLKYYVDFSGRITKILVSAVLVVEMFAEDLPKLIGVLIKPEFSNLDDSKNVAVSRIHFTR